MRFCPNCGTSFTPGQNSNCLRCGAALPSAQAAQQGDFQQAETIASSPNLQRDAFPVDRTVSATPWRESSSPSSPSYPAFPQPASGPYPYNGPPSSPSYPAFPQPASGPYQGSPSSPGYPPSTPIGYENAYGQFPPPPPYTPLSGPARTKKKRPATVLSIFLVVFALLIMGGGFWLIYYAAVSHPAALHAQATATVETRSTASAHVAATAETQATGTAIAQANATSTAIAQETAQAQATATAQQTLYTKSTSGTPNLDSPLSSQDDANWDQYDAVGGGGCAFSNGALHASVMQKNYYVPCFALNTNFGNFALQAQMTIVQGDEGGLIFRANETSSQFYLFRISQDGSYGLYVSKDDKHNTAIVDDSSSAIKKGTGQSNLVTLIAQGSNIYFYINKQYVGSVSDPSYASGKIGIFASNNGNNTDVAFNNVQVWTL